MTKLSRNCIVRFVKTNYKRTQFTIVNKRRFMWCLWRWWCLTIGFEIVELHVPFVITLKRGNSYYGTERVGTKHHNIHFEYTGCVTSCRNHLGGLVGGRARAHAWAPWTWREAWCRSCGVGAGWSRTERLLLYLGKERPRRLKVPPAAGARTRPQHVAPYLPSPLSFTIRPSTNLIMCIGNHHECTILENTLLRRDWGYFTAICNLPQVLSLLAILNAISNKYWVTQKNLFNFEVLL